MAEQSNREEMSAAIRAQRERNAVPKTIVPEPLTPAQSQHAPPEPATRRGFIRRRRGRMSS